jgi:hypothetical protein
VSSRREERAFPEGGVGAAFCVLPGIGRLLMAGPLARGLADTEEARAAGTSAFRTGLCGLGIPKASILRYESELCADRFLLIAHGTAEELICAKDVLHRTRPAEVNVHFAQEAGYHFKPGVHF